ncbi:MAG: gamma-glutamylcyclotransferase [Devosia sp.]|uniref:gamma-glutamylcyclotransferase n=1 Tax=Devosia sp. TaxID=1871048 RepID=UPI001AC53C30|nr:gamma-glutamylcyclotransferase [Devosia sp.]MBN9315152.1 gamma-glutamylcyclotransferase [Devosia sp.]
MAQISTHWVFGYGSLIWRPGFEFVRQEPALLRGVHRRLCVYSQRHRGTAAQPGLVFGLMPGGSCRGMAFEVAPERWGEVHAYLHEREMDNGVYREAVRPLRVGGAAVGALVFLADTRHLQYAGKLAIAEQVRLVLAGVGESGPNHEYVLETARKLGELGIRDRHLDEVVEALHGVDVPVAETA